MSNISLPSIESVKQATHTAFLASTLISAGLYISIPA